MDIYTVVMTNLRSLVSILNAIPMTFFKTGSSGSVGSFLFSACCVITVFLAMWSKWNK